MAAGKKGSFFDGGGGTIVAAVITGLVTLLVANLNNASNNRLLVIDTQQTEIARMQPTIYAQATTIAVGAQQMNDTSATSAAFQQQAVAVQATATGLEQKVGELTSQMSLERRGYIFQEAAERVVIEAENYSYMLPGSNSEGSRISWQVISDTIYSDQKALWASPVVGVNTLTKLIGPAAIYRIKFTNPGDYQVDIRGAAPAGPQHDSILVSIGGEPVTSGAPNGIGMGFKTEQPSWVHEDCRATQDNDRQCVEKLPTMIHIATPGNYNFILWMREDGVVIDKIILSTTYSNNDNIKNELPESERT